MPNIKNKLFIPAVIAIILAGSVLVGLGHGESIFRHAIALYLRINGIKSSIISVGNNNISCLSNNKISNQAVIFLHGLGGDALYSWFMLMPKMNSSDNIIAFNLSYKDFYGFDCSQYSLNYELDIINKILDQKHIQQADVVGLSVGAWTAAKFAARYPDRVGKLICIAPAGVDCSGLLERAEQLRRVDAKEFYSLIFNYPPPIPEFILNMHTANLHRVADDLLACLKRLNTTEESILVYAHSVTAPTLIIWGDDDKLLPVADAPKLEKAFPDARLVRFANCGHAVVWDQPDKLATVINAFLSGTAQ